MMHMPIPQVLGDHLLLHENSQATPSVPVGSSHWYTWLADAQNRSFSFRSHAGAFTARHERQRNNWYWYAYRKHQGKIYKAYLGKPQELTANRLNIVASTLSRKRPCQRSQQTIVSKLTIPALPSHVLARPRLIMRLQEGVQGRLTLLSAPAGWGKTTLLRQWCGERITQHLALSWLSLDTEDNQLTRFWSHLIAALDTLVPGLSEAVSPDLFTLSSLPEQGLQTLLNKLSSLSKHATLILDNYQALTNPAIHHALTILLELMPAQLHIVIASRIDPPLPLARFRAQRQLTEVRLKDLRFSLQEIIQFLPQITKSPFTYNQYAKLSTRTEGWITALHLITSAINEGVAIDEAIELPQRYITDYILEEVLPQQPEPVQSFLLSTSILDSFFDASSAEAISEQPDCQAILEMLAHANLFIEKPELPGDQYRYHTLFAEALRVRLGQAHPTLLPALYLRACSWYQQNGLLNEALQYARKATGDDTPIVHQSVPILQQETPTPSVLDGVFTQRENDVIQFLLHGASNREIASHLVISEGTVKKHVSNICGKLGVRSRTQAITHIINASIPA
ncbi:LuxR family transcriptional regulator [Ktedonospora formicarum]|uniref:HTH luxR-type domain-containing protein n=1 Tax=Ktedonospora formicarum TaxID=2778364 RepID=A0A8J3I0L4_9CHLR|nr:LuxR family transcriptional regulator [Ktedonospora formicarum]GHO46611.1 hypothetical protein KSX_47740 [Ktedonospora formicarum]